MCAEFQLQPTEARKKEAPKRTMHDSIFVRRLKECESKVQAGYGQQSLSLLSVLRVIGRGLLRPWHRCYNYR